MERILNYILLAICIFLVVLLVNSQCSNNKHVKQIIELKDKLSACENAPIKTDTVYIYDTIYEVKYIRPKPTSNPNTEVKSNCENIKQVYYSDTFEKKGAKIHWEALTTCNNDSAIIDYIRFPEIVIPKEIITNTKVLYDTVKVNVPAKIKSKFLIYGGAFGNNLTKFPGIEAGVGYLHKQSWGLMIGPSYVDKNVYGSLKVFVTF